MELLQQIVAWMLPAGTLDWFDLTDSQGTQTELHVTLTEKNGSSRFIVGACPTSHKRTV